MMIVVLSLSSRTIQVIMLDFETIFWTPPISRIQFIGGGWMWEGLGGRWGWVGSRRRAIPSIGHRQDCRAFNKTQKQPQCICQAKMVAGSSLTSHAALLVPPSGTMYPVVDRHAFTGSTKSCLWKQTWPSGALSLVCLEACITNITLLCTVSTKWLCIRTLYHTCGNLSWACMWISANETLTCKCMWKNFTSTGKSHWSLIFS